MLNLEELIVTLKHLEDYMTILHKKDIDTGDIEDLCCEVSEAIQHKLEDIQEKESYFNKHKILRDEFNFIPLTVN